MDPGGKKFACTLIRDTSPIWMGYHPMVPSFKINKISYFDNFTQASKSIINRCDALVIERFFSRQANANVSAEKLNLMIGNVITIARKKEKHVIATTASSWKRKYNYQKCVEYAKEIGYLKKDKHFVDTILMWAVYQDLEKFYRPLLKRGLGPYENFRKMERWYKFLSGLGETDRIKHQDQLKRIQKLKAKLRSRRMRCLKN
jgi:hypothetical protein